jgi:hypothetical protein
VEEKERGEEGECGKNLQANVEKPDKGEDLVDQVLALRVLEVVGDVEVLNELKKLHRKKKQNAFSSASALHPRHPIVDVAGDEEAKEAEAWWRVLWWWH